MADTGKNPFMDMFQNFGQSLNLPAPDVSGIIEYHQKNLQALQTVAQVGSTSAEALMDKQRAAMESTLSEITASVQSAMSAGTAIDPAEQMEKAKKIFETTLENSRDMAEIVKKGNVEAFEVLKSRVMESIDELGGTSAK